MKKVMMLSMGGTIVSVPNEAGVLVPAQNSEEILRKVPHLREKVELDYQVVENLDSTNINPSHWSRLIYAIAEIIDQYDGLIVSHGTDTMAYTASAVAIGLGRGLKIPIVFTGAQLPLLGFRTDATFNLQNSVETLLRAIDNNVAEVMIVFSDRVLRGVRAIKVSESRFTAFDSPAFPYLADITAIGISGFDRGLRVDDSITLSPQPHFQRGILTIDLVPGLEPGILLEILRSGKCQALLLKSLGAGNVPTLDEYSLLPVIEAAVQKHQIPVLVSTKFVGGKTEMEIYEPGKLALEAGAIPTGDMTDVMAQVKLMWALAQGHRGFDDLKRVINTDFVGEITV